MYRDSQQRSDNESGQINRISASALRMREIFQSFQFLVVFANEYPLGRMAPMGTHASGPPLHSVDKTIWYVLPIQ